MTMTTLQKKILSKSGGWLCSLALLLCACTQVKDHCGDFVSIAAGGQCPPSGNTPTTTYTVTYNINGGTGTTPAVQTVNAGSSVTLRPGTGFSRSGFTFGGWNTNTNGTGTNYNAGASFTPTGSITLFARWTASGGITPGDTGSFVDNRDGQRYRTVRIGTQTWMAQNLNFNASGSSCYYNSPDSCAVYGRLYTWVQAMGLPSTCNTNSCVGQVHSLHQGVCPVGWHVPSNEEWRALVNFVEGEDFWTAGTRLRALSGWYSGSNGTVEFGFSALPGGSRWSDGSFSHVGGWGSWWSATEGDATRALYHAMRLDHSVMVWDDYSKTGQFSVRCLRLNEIGSITTHTLTVNTSGTGSGNVTRSVGGSTTTATSFNAGTVVTLTAQPNSGSTFSGWSGGGCSGTGGCVVTMNSNVTVTATFTSSGGTTPSDTGRFTDSRDGREYRWVRIGTQVWMAENLNFNASGSSCYNNQESNCNTYGRLYDWAQAMDLPSNCNYTSCASQVQSPRHRGICPVGWHVPRNTEWQILVDYVGDASVAGMRLKSTSGWNNNGNGTDDFGFSALPGGYARRSSFNFNFSFVGRFGYWWGATEDDAGIAWYRIMDWSRGYVGRHASSKADLFSIRCRQD